MYTQVGTSDDAWDDERSVKSILDSPHSLVEAMGGGDRKEVTEGSIASVSSSVKKGMVIEDFGEICKAVTRDDDFLEITTDVLINTLFNLLQEVNINASHTSSSKTIKPM